MKRSAIIALSLMLAACSSLSSHDNEKAADTDRTAIQTFGSVQVKLDKKGMWSEISSVASAGVDSDSPRAQDAAMKLAITDAKRNITTFLGTTVGYNTVTNTNRNGDDITIKSTDNVTERASALLKGLMVDQQYVEGDRAFARVIIRKAELNVAKQVRADMLK